MSGKRAVFLSRDGVINPYHYNADFGTVDAPVAPEQFVLLPGVAEAISQWNRRNFAVIVVSNQPGIAKGKFNSRILQAITVKMVRQLADGGARLDDILYCTHHPQAFLPEHRTHCDCRKPKPGMLLRAAREHRLNLPGSFMVGNSVDDILAGRAAGVTTILLGGRRCSVCEEFLFRGAQPDRTAKDLKDAAQMIAGVGADSRQFSSVPRAAHPCLLTPAKAPNCSGDSAEAAGSAAGLDPLQIERLLAMVHAVRQYANRESATADGPKLNHTPGLVFPACRINSSR